MDTIEADESATPPGKRRGFPTAIAALGLFLAWVPGLGLLLALAALGMAIAARRQGRHDRSNRMAMLIAVFAILLGAGFTGAYLACTPSVETPAEHQKWDEFDKLFHEQKPAPAPSPAP